MKEDNVLPEDQGMLGLSRARLIQGRSPIRGVSKYEGRDYPTRGQRTRKCMYEREEDAAQNERCGVEEKMK